MKRIGRRVLTLFLALGMAFSLAACSKDGGEKEKEKEIDLSQYDFTVSYDGIEKGTVSSGVGVHDPSIFREGDTYYIFGSHMSAARSSDLKSWEKLADGYSPNNPVYGKIYEKAEEAFSWAGSPTISVNITDDADIGGREHVWAPSVIYNEVMGKYCMYGCTTSNWNTSNLYLATSDSVEGPYEWQAKFIFSGFNSETVQHTDVLQYVSKDHADMNYYRSGGKEYDYQLWPNAIDPTAFYDKDGKLWMIYGSWSGGFFMLELDQSTGLPIHPEADADNKVDAYFGKWVLGGGHKSIEAPFIHYDKNSDYYYLTAAYGGLTRDGGYQIRIFRSKNPDGPYEDMKGNVPTKDVLHEGYGLKATGNYMLPSLNIGYKAPGHNSGFVDEDGRSYLIFHTRFDANTEAHSPRVHQYLVNEEGWPCLLPYQTQGEQVSQTGYDKAKIVGKYYYVNLGLTVDGEMRPTKMLYLTEDGYVVTEDGTGKWECRDGTYYLHMNIGEESFSGVLCEMKDEAGTNVMTFSCVGGNTTVWGVKYGE